jgi:Xaa-Pro aminopeptidase
VKNPAELAGIRRAQAAAEAGMAAARDLLRRATGAHGGELVADGAPLTSERGRVRRLSLCAVGGRPPMGDGLLLAGEPIVIDLWPRDNESACFADITRTFVVGEIPDEVAYWHRHVKEVLDLAHSGLRPGVTGRALFDGTCDIFEAAGYVTQRTKAPDESLEDGFFHSLGHGVGLEVHEEPGLGMTGRKELVAGDVVAVEPGLYRQAFGGVRLEDLALITEDGAENLSSFPYDLEP